MSAPDYNKGIRTRHLLQWSVALLIAVTMASSLLLVRSRMRTSVQHSMQDDLQHSLDTFQDLQARRRDVLERENLLLANVPTLRALMTTQDERTVEDGAADFSRLGRNALFALADREGRVLAATDAAGPNRDLKQRLQAVLGTPTHAIFWPPTPCTNTRPLPSISDRVRAAHYSAM